MGLGYLEISYGKVAVLVERRFAFRFAALCLLLILTSIAAFATSRFFAQARKRSARDATANYFRQAALALHNYQDEIGHIPSAVQRVDGKHASSWRYVIWSYIERTAGYDRQCWDESWDGPRNMAVWEGTNLPFFCHPGSGDVTFILAVTGPGTAFGDGAESPRTFADMAPDTIVLIESKASGVQWPEPKDGDIDTIGALYKVGSSRGPSSIHEGGFHIAFADGEVWFLGSDTPFKVLEKFLTIDGAQQHDRDAELMQYRR